jgi:hypothetical protein
MRAVRRTTLAKLRTPEAIADSDNRPPQCLPDEAPLDEASLRALLTLFELLDWWDLEGENHEK